MTKSQITLAIVAVSVAFIGIFLYLRGDISDDNLLEGFGNLTSEEVSEGSVAFIGTTRVKLLETKKPEEMHRGLGGRGALASDEAMLFDFGAPQESSIWMKDMQFPIDVVWLDEAFQIVHIVERMEPSSYPKIYTSSLPARYVLEFNAGFVALHTLEVSDVIVIRRK